MKKLPLALLLLAVTAFSTFAQTCYNVGTGANGAYVAASSTTIAGGTYNFTTFDVYPGVTLTVTGVQPLIIHCTGNATISGNIVANGGNGTNGVTSVSAGTGGLGVAGGGNGGDGAYSVSNGPLPGVAGNGPGAVGNQGDGWSGGGGAGYANTGGTSGSSSGGFGGPAYGNIWLQGLPAGSGGGGGSGGYSCGSGGGGGGGGLIVFNTGGTLTMSFGSGIYVNGGNGGSDGTGNCGGGGGGSGGTVWLAAPHLDLGGTISALGGTGGTSSVSGSPYFGEGGNGSPGRIRFDTNVMSGGISGTTPSPLIGGIPVQPLSVTTSSTPHGCQQGTATANAADGQGTYSYEWSTNANTATINVPAAGNYTVTVTDGFNCQVSASVNVSSLSPVNLSGTATNNNCFGDSQGSVDITASGGTPYNNSTKGLLISEVAANPSGTDAPFEFVELLATKSIDFSATPYTVVFSNNGIGTFNGWLEGAAITYAFEITTGTVQAGDVVYVGGTSMLPVNNRLRAINTSNTTGDGGIGNASSSGSLGNGGANADGVAVFDLPLFSMSSSTPPIDAVFYGTGVGSAVVSGGTAGYQLPVNDNYNGGKLQTNSFIGPEPLNGGYMAGAGVFNVRTNTFTTPRTWANTSTFTDVATSVVLEGLYSYTWSNGDTTEDLDNLTAGTYDVTVTDAVGCLATASYTVSEPAQLIVTASASNDTVCQGSLVTLTGGGATTYAWSNNVTDGVAFAAASTNTYTVTGTDGNNCTATATVTVDVNLLPTVTANTNAAAVCEGSLVTLTGGGAITYTWSDNVTDGTSFAPAASNTYSVTGTDANSCSATATVTVDVNLLPTVTANTNAAAVCEGSLVTLTGGGATTYTWSDNVTDGTAFAPAATNTYTVTGTDANSCSATATVTVDVNLLPTVTATTNAAAVCEGSLVTLTAGGATAYAWSDNVTDGTAFAPAASNTYTVTGTDANSCSATATVTVDVNLLPTVTANTNAAAVCEGSLVTLTGGGATTYTWSNNVTDGTSFAPAATNTYTVTGTDANSCSATATVTVDVNLLPTVTASTNTATVCEGSLVTLTGGGATTYAWSDNVTDGTAFAPAATNTYTVTGTDANSCSATATVTVDVNTLDATATAAGAVLTATASGATYVWINCATNLPVSNATSQTYTATANGNYAVIVTQNGCTDTSTCLNVTGVGIAEQSALSNIMLYPNPANSRLTISGDQLLHVTVYDATGRAVLNQAAEGNLLTVDVAELSAGAYTVKVTTINGPATLPLLKQ